MNNSNGLGAFLMAALLLGIIGFLVSRGESGRSIISFIAEWRLVGSGIILLVAAGILAVRYFFRQPGPPIA